MDIIQQQQRLSAIRERLIMLVQENDALIRTNLQLEARQKELKQLLEIQKQTIRDLEDKNKVARLGQAVSGENNKDLKLKINELIRDIDKALGMLGA